MSPFSTLNNCGSSSSEYSRRNFPTFVSRGSSPDFGLDPNGSTPVFIVVANAEHVDDIFNDPLSAISYFEKLPEGETGFNLDLSATALVPEDEIMVIAFWDRDYEAGIPGLSEGDMAGVYQNKAESRPTILLSEINSSIPSGDWEFIINRNVFQHNAEIAFSLEGGAGVALTS